MPLRPWRNADIPLEVLVDEGAVVPTLLGHPLQVPRGRRVDEAPAADPASTGVPAMPQMQRARIVGRCGQTLDGARPRRNW